MTSKIFGVALWKVLRLTANLAPQGLRNHLGGFLRGVVLTGCCRGFMVRFANGSSDGWADYKGVIISE